MSAIALLLGDKRTSNGLIRPPRLMMGWTPRPTASMCQSGDVEHHLREASVSKVIMIGLDIAKHVFHVHGADERGRAIFRKRISRGRLLDFFAGGKQKLGATSKMGDARSGAYSSSAAAPSCNRRANAARQRVRGSNRC
jgi:hypothetical protein